MRWRGHFLREVSKVIVLTTDWLRRDKLGVGWGGLTSGGRASIEGDVDGIACACGTVECDADSICAGCQGRGESLSQRKASGEAENALHCEDKNIKI